MARTKQITKKARHDGDALVSVHLSAADAAGLEDHARVLGVTPLELARMAVLLMARPRREDGIGLYRYLLRPDVRTDALPHRASSPGA